MYLLEKFLINTQIIFQETLQDTRLIKITLIIFFIIQGFQEIHYIFFEDQFKNHFYESIDVFLITNSLFTKYDDQLVGLLMINLVSLILILSLSYFRIYGKLLFLIICNVRYTIFVPSIYFSSIQIFESNQAYVQIEAVSLIFISVTLNLFISSFNSQLQPNQFQGCFSYFNLPLEILIRILQISMILSCKINENLSFLILEIRNLFLTYLFLQSYFVNIRFLIILTTLQSAVAFIIILNINMLHSLLIFSLLYFIIQTLIDYLQHLQLQNLLVEKLCTLEQASLMHNQQTPILQLIFKKQHLCNTQLMITDYIQISIIIKNNSLYFAYLYQLANTKPILALKLINSMKTQLSFRDKIILKSIQKIAIQSYTNHQQYSTKQRTESINPNGLIQSYYESQQLLIYLQILVERKIQFQEFLIKGNYENDCNEQIVQLSSQLYKCFIHFKNCQTIQNKQFNDLFSFKIKELYYAFIVNNFQQTIKLESQINQQLEYERGQLNQYLSNNSLFTNRSIILQTSLYKNDGILINFNQKQAQIFLESNQQTNIKHITDLMPRYIQNVHNQLFKNFIEKGESQLQIKGLNSFYVNMEGYLKPCYINLGPILLQQGIISTILTQDSKQIDYILFDLDGTIIGLTQKFQKKLNKFSKRYDDIRNRKIQEYVNVNNIIQLLKQEIDNNNNYQIDNQVIEWRVNLYRTQESQYYNNYSEQYYTQKSDSFVINNVLIPLMNQQSITKYTTITNSTNNYSIINLKIILSFRQIHDFHYFMIQIQDFMHQDKKSIKKQKSIKNNQEFNEIPINDNINTERSHNNNQIIINQINSYNQQFVLDNYFMDLTKQIEEQTHKPHIFVNSSRNPIFSSRISNRHLILDHSQSQSQIQLKQVSIQPKQVIQDYNINEINQIEIELRNLQLQDDQTLDKQQVQKQSVDIDKSKSQDNSKEVVQYTINNQSLSSVTTTKFNRISEINDKIISQRISRLTLIYLFIACFYVCLNLMEILLNQSLINQQTTFFLNKLTTLYPSQGMTFYTSSWISMQWVELLQQQNFTQYSPFLESRKQGQLAYTKRAVSVGWFSAVTQLCQQQTKNNINFNITYWGYTNNDCYSIYQSFLNEQKVMYEKNKNNVKFDFSALQGDQVIRKTLLPAFKLQDQVIDLGINAIKDQQQQTIPKFLLLLIVFIILLFSLLMIIIYIMIYNNRSINNITNYIINQKQQDMIEQLAGLVLIRDLLKGNKNTFWWSENYSNYTQIENEIMLNNHQQNSQNIQRKRQHKYKDYKNISLVIVQIFLMLVFLLIGYYVFLMDYNQFTPSLNITYSFFKFKMRLDFTIQLGAIIKTEKFIDFNKNVQFDELDTILTFKELVEFTLPAMQNITKNLFLIDNTQVIILQTLNDNLCLNFGSSLPFCQINKIKLQYYPIDNYQNLIDKGIIGILAQLTQYVQQEFNYEFQNLKYVSDYNQMIKIVNSQMYHNLFQQYLMDLEVSLYYLFSYFQKMNAALNNKIINDLYNYNYIVGPLLIVIQTFIFIYYILKKYEQSLQYKLLLTLVPYSKLQEKNIQLQILFILKQIE